MHDRENTDAESRSEAKSTGPEACEPWVTEACPVTVGMPVCGS